ncbi:hypothetical protein DSO57_1018349 [Entomophthora muscae]|uniref:Uncharacterized protein n=1 Tax=Entomophthora muscae TaxID=34485 RepID=A0ACC2SHE0_9FUNG|nr:hypothetical protein DSO57_1018349 [Entomophthora muscae]
MELQASSFSNTAIKTQARSERDSANRAPLSSFEVGKGVAFCNTQGKVRSHKLEKLWVGPFEIIEKTSPDAYTIKDKDSGRIFNRHNTHSVHDGHDQGQLPIRQATQTILNGKACSQHQSLDNKSLIRIVDWKTLLTPQHLATSEFQDGLHLAQATTRKQRLRNQKKIAQQSYVGKVLGRIPSFQLLQGEVNGSGQLIMLAVRRQSPHWRVELGLGPQAWDQTQTTARLKSITWAYLAYTATLD